VDEGEVDRLTLLSDLQKTAVLKRIRVRRPARARRIGHIQLPLTIVGGHACDMMMVRAVPQPAAGG